jgi:uncharacterized protein (DUF362 family)
VVLVRDEGAIRDDGSADEAVIEAMLDRAMFALTREENRSAAWSRIINWSGVFKSDDRVGIKSNLMMTPTHPELLRAICRGLKAAGVPDEMITTWDRDRAGVGEAEVGSLPRRVGFGRYDVSEVVLRSTALINVPGLKSHWLAGIACALKNWAGAVTGINTRDENVTYAFHANSCQHTGALSRIPPIWRKCRLVIVDALRPLCHGGPQADPRYLWAYRGLLVGRDPVAVDTVGLAIIQGRRNQLKGGDWPIQPRVTHLTAADEKYRLGISDRSRIDVVKIGWDEEALV